MFKKILSISIFVIILSILSACASSVPPPRPQDPYKEYISSSMHAGKGKFRIFYPKEWKIKEYDTDKEVNGKNEVIFASPDLDERISVVVSRPKNLDIILKNMQVYEKRPVWLRGNELGLYVKGSLFKENTAKFNIVYVPRVNYLYKIKLNKESSKIFDFIIDTFQIIAPNQTSVELHWGNSLQEKNCSGETFPTLVSLPFDPDDPENTIVKAVLFLIRGLDMNLDNKGYYSALPDETVLNNITHKGNTIILTFAEESYDLNKSYCNDLKKEKQLKRTIQSIAPFKGKKVVIKKISAKDLY